MPASELINADEEVVAGLAAKLVDPAVSLPERYRVLFSLRNVKGKAAHDALALGAGAGQAAGGPIT